MNEKVFRDPVHDYVHVDHPIIYQLINSKEFQRLRRIKQLGTSGFTFHGGEHSRFSHCLGAYEISDHEKMTQLIITSPETEVNQILLQVAPDFPNRVASVIDHTYPNKQVVQLISSQIDVDRMDYLLRDAYFTGASYGKFDLTRILRVIRPIENGIAFQQNGMHAVEDYVVSRYQMYMQVYFHPATRAMEVLLQNLLKRARTIYPDQKEYFQLTSPRLIPFFEEEVTIQDYLNLDDGVMNTYFQVWMDSPDTILSDLAQRYINRKVFKSILFTEDKRKDLAILEKLIKEVGFNPTYYTAIHQNFDLPYDIYRPELEKPRTQIEMIRKDGSLAELSQLSPLVAALAGTRYGDNRFYFPKEMLEVNGLFSKQVEEFTSYITNDYFTGETDVH